MRYSIGDCLGEYGFQFYEKLHEPIFLISKVGKIVKMNEAGRKLLRVAHLSLVEAETNLKEFLFKKENFKPVERILLKSKKMDIHLIASDLVNSDYLLVEVTH
ncbi:MAG: hypothetical protein H7256_08885 [Bdellovibrio sp.]|nr:hypothetical protein [Bdellovibrio sp.]